MNIFIGFGSNKGRRLFQIQNAIKELQKNGDCKFISSSFMYETLPMHILDQARFLNCACKFRTSLTLEALLEKCKMIESQIGRTKSLIPLRYGPREIDIDILGSDSHSIVSDKLTVPHPLLIQREFVLKPLCDIDPAATFCGHNLTIGRHLRDLEMEKHSNPNLPGSILSNYVLLACSTFEESESRTILLHHPSSPPMLMGVINMSSDSFSFSKSEKQMFDSSKCQFEEHQYKAMIDQTADGASIIDVGGESTRPGSQPVSDLQQLDRVMEVLNQIKQNNNIVTSIDTCSPQVAETAIVHGGASIINYVYGGRPDSDIEMLNVASRHQVPIILCHSRGSASNMSKLNKYGSNEDDLLDIVGNEIESGVERALSQGILNWNIIIDPGFGFAKSPAQSLCILRNLSKIRRRFYQYPLLIGVSRKGLSEVNNSDNVSSRDVSSAVLASIGVMNGADIVRTHNVPLTKTMLSIASKLRHSS